LPNNSTLFLQLWFTRVEDSTRELEQDTEQQLSHSENQRLQATRNPNKRREYLLSRALMRHVLTQHFGSETNHWEFIERSCQAPTICYLPDNIHFSLSHSKGTICFALASCPIGIDLEKLNPKRNFLELAKAVMCEEEIVLLEQQPDKLAENFYRYWCAKEAYYKMLPEQQQSKIALKELSIPALQQNTDQTVLMCKQNAEFMLTIVTQEKTEQLASHAFPSDDQFIAKLAQSFS